MAALPAAEVEALARLAQLALTPAEVELLRGELGAILDHVAALAAVDVAGVAPLTHVVPGARALRVDVPGEPLPAEVALAGAPATRDEHFLVPAAIPGGHGR